MTGQALIVQGNALRLPLPDASVDLIVTSPPYAFLRAYDTGYPHLEVGAEATPAEFLEHLWQATAEMIRVLKPTGSIFVDLGDVYSSKTKGSGGTGKSTLGIGADGIDRMNDHGRLLGQLRSQTSVRRIDPGVPAKSLMLLPERYRIGCVDQLGLIARAVIVWDKPNCLSGGAIIYARVKGRPLAIRVHDLCRAYQPEDVQLWNGQRWTQAVHWEPTARDEDEPALEIELRSGERIGCTREHRWPTTSLRGVVRADELQVGDVLETTPLPEGETTPAALDDQMVGWFVGLYIAEGSCSEQTIQIAGHVNELERYKQLRELAEAFHGTCVVHATGGNAATINLTGRILNAIIDTYVGGKTAKDKHLAPKCWQRSNAFLGAVLDGYLHGDGHWSEIERRWVVSFTDNDALAADLRTLGARGGLSVRLRRVTHTGFGKEWPGWRGSVTNWNQRRQPDAQIVTIRQSRARQFWDIGVEDDPHLFALASGVLTHNSLPESVTDRVRRSHEDWVHLTRQPRYYSAIDEVRESYSEGTHAHRRDGRPTAGDLSRRAARPDNGGPPQFSIDAQNPLGKLPGSVWTIPSEPLRLPDHLGVQHYAAMPSEWPRRLILGWSPDGICLDCQQGRVPVVEREKHDSTPRRVGVGAGRGSLQENTYGFNAPGDTRASVSATILGYACACTPHTNHPGSGSPPRDVTVKMPGTIPRAARRSEGVDYYQPVGPWREYHLDGWKAPPTRPAVVLDPFSGVGTTVGVARKLGRIGIGVDLSRSYCRAARWRVFDSASFSKAQSRTWVDRQGELL